jgi:hydroxymethylglutaryl-CoA lyase
MVQELKDLYKRIAKDKSIFRIYLTGQGRVFSAGMDLSARGNATSNDEETHLAQMNAFRALLSAIEDAPQVTIAIINGSCYGGGNGLAFANDVRICTREATFNLTEVRLGLAPCAISPVLAREWGIPLFRSAMLTGRPVPAEIWCRGGYGGVVWGDVGGLGEELWGLCAGGVGGL